MTRPPAPPLRAALGPTNTGKTHLAVERMLGHRTGMIGLPLRLLAREIYDRVRAQAGDRAVALVTGEERIVPDTRQGGPRYWVCTTEAMPLSQQVDFLAVDEIQLCADHERGHVFTHRLLHARGAAETMVMGAATMAPLIRRLLPGTEIDARERFSALRYAGYQRITALPRRSAIVAFSVEEVYAIAELLRRKRGGAAVVMGALSPRTRNAQVELFQSGEVDFIVATDAIGMGLNLEIDHVAFASLSKFDGRRRRRLTPAEMGQIAGRAGRFRNSGTFGLTGDAPPLDPADVERLEAHSFKPLETVEWRNFDLDLSSLESLHTTLGAPPPDVSLRRVRGALDEESLRRLIDNPAIAAAARTPAGVRRLWAVCQAPDFRKLGLDPHVRLLTAIFTHLTDDGRLPPEWLGGQIARLDNVNGDVDTLSVRLAQVRTWAYLANRDDWLGGDANHWRAVARDVEDRLSDALHERLILRFVDRRTSALLRGLREDGILLAGLSSDGDVTVEGHAVGRIDGLSVTLDASEGGLEAKALRGAAERALRPEIDRRLAALAGDGDAAFALDPQGRVDWRGHPAARLAPGPDALKPLIVLTGGELGSGEARARAQKRIETWLHDHIAHALAPLLTLEAASRDARLRGLARGIAWRLRERLGAADRRDLADDVAALAPEERRALRAAGVEIGRFSLYLPALLKPAPAALLARLRATHAGTGIVLPAPGLTSIALAEGADHAALAVAGFRAAGPRAVRLDILEALGADIEAARAADPGPGFALTPGMTARLGCSLDDLRGVLRALGYTTMQKGQAGAAEGETPELWRRRGAQTGAHARRAPPAPPSPPADSPFAVLAALQPPTLTKTETAAAAKRRPGRRRSRARKRGAIGSGE